MTDREASARFVLAGGAIEYSAQEAIDAIRRYAFATERIKPDPRFPDAFEPHDVPLFAYRTYDCVPASEGADLTDLDILVAAGLNARVDMPTFARLRSFANRAAGHLHRAYEIQPDFLQMDRDEIGDAPPQGSAGWHLTEAWRQGMATPGLKVARVYKVLHHKRRRLFPLIDNLTALPISAAAKTAGCGLWQLIYDEIHANFQQFRQLEHGFDAIAKDPQDVALSALRLYDILVWMRVASV